MVGKYGEMNNESYSEYRMVTKNDLFDNTEEEGRSKYVQRILEKHVAKQGWKLFDHTEWDETKPLCIEEGVLKVDFFGETGIVGSNCDGKFLAKGLQTWGEIKDLLDTKPLWNTVATKNHQYDNYPCLYMRAVRHLFCSCL